MIVNDLVNRTTFEEIWGTLDPASQENLELRERFESMWSTLSELEPKKGPEPLTIAVCQGELYLEAVGIDDNRDAYSLIATPWEECLGLLVDEITLEKHSEAVVLRELMWSISWLGWTQEEIKLALAELEKESGAS